MSEITPTVDRYTEVHTHTRRIAFDGAAAEEFKGYTHKGKQWIPDMALAKWKHGEAIQEIELYGAILKKDGAPGQMRVDKRYVTPAHIGWNTRWNTNAPEWLTELFADSQHVS